jgi:HlyD family secretion protein
MKRAMRCSARIPDPAAWLLIGLVAAFGGCSKDDPAEATQPVLGTVVRGPLQITVTEGGSLASATPVKIVNEMEGRATILFLVKEGTLVNKGDVVVKLDSAEVRDRINDFEVRVEQEDAAYKQAQEKHAIQLNQNDSDVTMAGLEADFARTDYDKYVNGDYPQRKKRLEADLTIAEEELKRALDRVTWSRRLEEKKFITRTELEADELAAKKSAINVDLAGNALKVLAEYEYPKEATKLKAERDEKGKELERVKRRATAEAAKTGSDMSSRKRTLSLAEERLGRARSQLEKSVITAPASGIVVYAREDRGRWASSEPVSEGKQVHEREQILQIPDTRRMIVQLDVHESVVKKVKPGLPATIRLDAMPGRTFTGNVQAVSSVPSTSNQWMNPDLKVYPTEIHINEELEDLKPGMNANVEVLVADLPDVLHCPMQAIHQSGGRTFAYVDRGGKPELVPVDVGLNNERSVVVTAGLNEGDRVYLALPPDAPVLPQPATPRPGPGETPGEGDTPAANGTDQRAMPAGAGGGADGAGGQGRPGAGGGQRPPRGERPRPRDP